MNRRGRRRTVGRPDAEGRRRDRRGPVSDQEVPRPEMHHGKYDSSSACCSSRWPVRVFVISPYVQAVSIAMTDWQGHTADWHYIGLDNFVRVFHDPFSDGRCGTTCSCWWSARSSIGDPGAVLLRRCCNHRAAGSAVAASTGSSTSSPACCRSRWSAVLWQFVFEPRNGLLNGFLRAVGLGSCARSGSATARPRSSSMMAVMVWGRSGSTWCCSPRRWRRSRRICTRRRCSTAPNPVAVVLADRAAVDLGQRAGRDRLLDDRRAGHVRGGARS